MNTIKRSVLLLAAALVILFGLAACGTTPAVVTVPAVETIVPLTEQQVSTIVENMLSGYNNGDYAAFSRDLSPALKLVITEERFQTFVNESKATLGQFQSLTSVVQGDTGNTSSDWVVTAQFEKSTLEFKVTFDKATGQIEGMDFGPK